MGSGRLLLAEVCLLFSLELSLTGLTTETCSSTAPGSCPSASSAAVMQLNHTCQPMNKRFSQYRCAFEARLASVCVAGSRPTICIHACAVVSLHGRAKCDASLLHGKQPEAPLLSMHAAGEHMYRACIPVAGYRHKAGSHMCFNVRKTGVTPDHTVPMVLQRSRQDCQHQGFQKIKHGHAIDAYILCQ